MLIESLGAHLEKRGRLSSYCCFYLRRGGVLEDPVMGTITLIRLDAASVTRQHRAEGTVGMAVSRWG